MDREIEFDLENPLTSSDEEQRCSDSTAALFAAEADHMVSNAGSIDISLRRDAVSIILQAQFDCNLDPFLIYLAVNYVDRFLSKGEIPREKPWMVRLLAIACLSLASKMTKADFSIADFQSEEGFIFDTRTIRRMELLVLGELDWRMRSITPFSFLRFFIAFFSPANPPLLQVLKSYASEALFKAQTDIRMVKFKPSVVAAAMLLSAAYELLPIQYVTFRSAIAACQFVNEDELRNCSIAIHDAEMECQDLMKETMMSSCDTPVTLLRRRCASSESELGSPSDDRDLKKRRISALPTCYYTNERP